MRLRRRALGSALGAGVLFLIGTNAQAGWLFVLAVLLVGAAAAGVVLPLVGLRGLTVDLEAPAETRQGSETPVRLRVRNGGHSVRWGIVAHDEHLGGATTWAGSVRPGETVTVTSGRGAPRRGEAHPGWVELRSAAPFGFAERRRRLPVEGSTLVLPRLVPIAEPLFIETAAAREPAARSDPRRGAGPEYLGVREYRPGDPIRQIHWRLTARHGELVVRDLEQERTPRLVIWLDTSSGVDEMLDACCSAAASLVEAATATGAGVRLAAATPDGPVSVTRARTIDVHRWLARLTGSGVDPSTSLGWLGPEVLRGAGTLVAIVPGATADAAAASLGALVGSVPRLVAVVVIDPGSEADLVDGVAAHLPAGLDVVPWIDGKGFDVPVRRPVGAAR
jgi:uncharacterized protein (DUF58 family)